MNERESAYNSLSGPGKHLIHLLYGLPETPEGIRELLNIKPVIMEGLISQFDMDMGQEVRIRQFANGIGFSIPSNVDSSIFLYNALKTFLESDRESVGSSDICGLPATLFTQETLVYLKKCVDTVIK